MGGDEAHAGGSLSDRLIVKTLTFYSYKGGTGRSLLLANAARYLALLGERVVAVDFDFEAPGLHYKLNISPPGQRTADAIPERGAVDYLLAVARGDGPPKSLRDYVVPIPLPQATQGSLHLMPAGSAPTGAYWKALTALLQQDLFSDPEGRVLAACLELKARIEEELRADFLLIDSRTGVTELAGLTTTVLTDKVVCLMLANRESQIGARAVLRSLRRAARLTGQPPIEVVPVLSRVPADRGELMARDALSFLNEPGPTPEETLALEKVFILRTDPDLAHYERLHVGSGETQRQSLLYKDYLILLTELAEADPAKVAAAALRQEAVRETRKWLTGTGQTKPIGMPAVLDEQIREGVEIRGEEGETRYADLVVYSGVDRTEALIAVEYIEDLASADVSESTATDTASQNSPSAIASKETSATIASQWWLSKTKVHYVVLAGKKGKLTQWQVFTRGLPHRLYQGIQNPPADPTEPD